MPIKLIGRTTDFSGKTLWEIVGNLKNFGVGRLVIRNMFQRYPESTFLKIVKVEPLANEEPRKVRIWAEKVFRGYKQPKLVQIFSTSYKPDYRLIPKDQESKYLEGIKDEIEEKILPAEIDFPPLLKELILRDKMAKGEFVEDVKLPLKIKSGRENKARIAKPGEIPNVQVEIGLGKPSSPELYKGIDL